MTQDIDDTYDLIHSPLARMLSGEGHTLEIDIYRGVDEPDWILEIEDETGTLTRQALSAPTTPIIPRHDSD